MAHTAPGAGLNLLEETALIGRLFERLLQLEDDAREDFLDRDPVNRNLLFDEKRSRENLAALLSETPEEVLLELYEDVVGRPWNKPYKELAQSGHWQEGRLRLFMSHCSSQKVFVDEVAQALSQFGIDAFVAHEDIEPLRTWESEIEAALRSCHACTAFLSEDFHESKWTDQEIGFCFARGLLVVPIRMGLDPYGFLFKYQALTLATDMDAEATARKIFAILREDERLEELFDWALLFQFVESRSWMDAKDRWRLVKDQIQRWPPERRLLLEVSLERNHQIQGAHYGNLPATIRRFLEDLPAAESTAAGSSSGSF